MLVIGKPSKAFLVFDQETNHPGLDSGTLQRENSMSCSPCEAEDTAMSRTNSAKTLVGLLRSVSTTQR